MKGSPKIYTWMAMLPLLATALGCAKSNDENIDDIEKRLLQAYVHENYTKVNRPIDSTASGLYYVMQPGDAAAAAPGDSNYVFVNYTMCDLHGNVLTSSSVTLTNNAAVATQLGVFSYATYYGAKIWRVGAGTLYSGLDEALRMMRPNGKAHILLPSWCSDVGGSRQFASTIIIDVELLRVISNINTFETDTLEAFSSRYYGAMDSLKADWYYTDIVEGSGEVAAVGDTLDVRYVGYLLDGFVFDTNIADSASYYKIYNAANTYDKLAVIYKANESTEEGAEEGTMEVVDGFKYALLRMKTGGEAVTFFSSHYGYEATASGQIQMYSPLRFYIKLERIGRAPVEEAE